MFQLNAPMTATMTTNRIHSKVLLIRVDFFLLFLVDIRPPFLFTYTSMLLKKVNIKKKRLCKLKKFTQSSHIKLMNYKRCIAYIKVNIVIRIPRNKYVLPVLLKYLHFSFKPLDFLKVIFISSGYRFIVIP